MPGLITTALAFVALSGASLLAGYHLGKLSQPAIENKERNDQDVKLHDVAEDERPENDESDIVDADGDLSAVQAGFMEPCKMVREKLSVTLI